MAIPNVQLPYRNIIPRPGPLVVLSLSARSDAQENRLGTRRPRRHTSATNPISAYSRTGD